MEVWETEAGGWHRDERRERAGKERDGGKRGGGQGGRKPDTNNYTKGEKGSNRAIKEHAHAEVGEERSAACVQCTRIVNNKQTLALDNHSAGCQRWRKRVRKHEKEHRGRQTGVKQQSRRKRQHGGR